MSNISWHCATVKAAFNAAFLASMMLAGSVAASEPQSTAAPKVENDTGSQLWLTTGFRSYHFKRSAGYNENNAGLGFEWRFSPEQAIVGGFYDNSVRRDSHYLHYVWTPIHLDPIRIGAAAGIIDGYPEMNRGKFAFSLIPVASLHFKIFSHDAGLNLVYIPTVTQRVDGSLALQLKIRLK